MARIRNIKPEFFRHEELQKLGPITMLVFQGLWCQSDKAGNFPWRLAQLKLDILPFIEYDLGSSMEALRKTGFVTPYTGEDGKAYGNIPNFSTHQRFSGTELKGSPKYPAFLGEPKQLEVPKDFHGSSEEATGKHDGRTELGVRTKDNGVRTPKEKKHAFEDSPYFDKKTFRAKFPDWDENKCRDWYTQAIEYSGANGGRYLDWGLAIQGWERRDAKKQTQGARRFSSSEPINSHLKKLG